MRTPAVAVRRSWWNACAQRAEGLWCELLAFLHLCGVILYVTRSQYGVCCEAQHLRRARTDEG